MDNEFLFLCFYMEKQTHSKKAHFIPLLRKKIYLNPSMVVSRRHVIRNISSTNFEQRKKAESQEDLVVQFAFDNPPFIPDFRLTNLRLAEDKYPVATADYFANDIYYKIEYAATVLDDSQTLLCLRVGAKMKVIKSNKL